MLSTVKQMNKFFDNDNLGKLFMKLYRVVCQYTVFAKEYAMADDIVSTGNLLCYVLSHGFYKFRDECV